MAEPLNRHLALAAKFQLQLKSGKRAELGGKGPGSGEGISEEEIWTGQSGVVIREGGEGRSGFRTLPPFDVGSLSGRVELGGNLPRGSGTQRSGKGGQERKNAFPSPGLRSSWTTSVNNSLLSTSCDLNPALSSLTKESEKLRKKCAHRDVVKRPSFFLERRLRKTELGGRCVWRSATDEN